MPPAMGERDLSSASWIADASIRFSDAKGNVSRFSGRAISIVSPESIMAESEAKKLSPDRMQGFYEPSWYLPDARFAEFESLPIVKQTREFIDKALKTQE